MRAILYGFEIGDAGPIQVKRVSDAAGHVDRLARSWATGDGYTCWSPFGAVVFPDALERLREIRVRFGPITRANAQAIKAALLAAYAELLPRLPLEGSPEPAIGLAAGSRASV